MVSFHHCCLLPRYLPLIQAIPVSRMPTSYSSAMGKSRSTTCVMAYLMQKYHLTPHVALARVRQCRPLCEPNNGFMKQLELYHRVDCTSNIDENPQYQRWLYQCEVERSIACGKAPDQVRFEDEQRSSSTALGGSVELRCRKCRYGPGFAVSWFRLMIDPPDGLWLPINSSSGIQQARLKAKGGNHGHVLIISWSRCRGCGPSSSMEGWPANWNVPNARPL